MERDTFKYTLMLARDIKKKRKEIIIFIIDNFRRSEFKEKQV